MAFIIKIILTKAISKLFHNDKEVFVFNYLGSLHKPYDSVYCVQIDKSGKVIQTNVRLAFENVKFRLKV